MNVAQAQAWPLPFADTRSGYPLLKDVVGFDEKKIFFCKLSMTELICGATIQLLMNHGIEVPTDCTINTSEKQPASDYSPP